MGIYGGNPPLTLTVLIPQTIDEWFGKVELQGLEHRPFGTSIVAQESVLALSTSQKNQVQLQRVLGYWKKLVIWEKSLGGERGVLPTLRFCLSRPKEQNEDA